MIRKPNIVKGIPMLLVRALPTIYYYGHYAQKNISPKAKLVFDDNVKYLSEAIKRMASVMSDGELESLAIEVRQLSLLEPTRIESEVLRLTANLSNVCLTEKDILKKQYMGKDGLKEFLIKRYRNMVESTKVLLIDNNNEPEWVDKLASTLIYSCYYDVFKTKPGVERFSENILESDFVIFASATPQSIHEDVLYLETYHKPGLILGTIKKDEKLDQQTIRNGSWLRNKGYEVLYKIFSPMRLFTSIDKKNINFLLQRI